MTDVAWFDVLMENPSGDGQDVAGRFEVALFGLSAPMTVMNFFNLVKGYKRGKVGGFGEAFERVGWDWVGLVGSWGS